LHLRCGIGIALASFTKLTLKIAEVQNVFSGRNSCAFIHDLISGRCSPHHHWHPGSGHAEWSFES